MCQIGGWKEMEILRASWQAKLIKNVAGNA